MLVFFLGDLEGEAVCGGVWSHWAIFLLEKHQETGVNSGKEAGWEDVVGRGQEDRPPTHDGKQGGAVDAADLLWEEPVDDVERGLVDGFVVMALQGLNLVQATQLLDPKAQLIDPQAQLLPVTRLVCNLRRKPNCFHLGL